MGGCGGEDGGCGVKMVAVVVVMEVVVEMVMVVMAVEKELVM